MEENGTCEPRDLLAGKFKDVDALVHAYEELEAEFTRRSQKLKVLESSASAEEKAETKDAEGDADAAQPACETCDDGERLYRAASENEEERARILGDYLASCRGVSLLGGSGTGVTAPVERPKNIREAGALALGYLKKI